MPTPPTRGLFSGGSQRRPAPKAGLTTARAPVFARDGEEWLQGGQWLQLASSHVDAALWDADLSKLRVRYDDGAEWEYDISPEQAADFIGAASRGGWLWDNVKIRGQVHGHRVPAVRIR